ncbi:MAG: division/cell wall cluster transcriptional repressor MraZ [Thiotrichales bacterium]|jgi:MraZ protein|nr:division/cell wall cluster transcriptional repressor MraZ [Thiotrichales bacterium]MBT3613674.1 division/cell wall cluster transcriptional repressor MraZ [Thiotrichales bacterium]MBT3753189.1 division/cell wall cluster transcriptional repressor MraZ [Thiotrichales bacterium]MBT3837741.1 division/cell wall cluster transcriptional repressor MraZ [Thiotrichales bacterium]MBT4152427.1 division/cell wall cluster transcriptional repressor MraZ [Thiotrichales bacterium]
MFRGNRSVSLDSKGRVAIPAQHRAEIINGSGGHIVVSPNIRAKCLNLYPLSEWEEVERRIGELSGVQQDTMRRLVIGQSRDCDLDSNGRIRLSDELCKHADLDKLVRVVGVGNKMELWNDAAWSKAAPLTKLDEDILSQLDDFYI